MRKTIMLVMLVVAVILAIPASAQDDIDTSGITDDEVNAVAEQLYCPVCENIPLDVCETAACQDWRYEIRLQLAEGLSEQAIIDDFVDRFGERVVGTPQDPVLRNLSLITPWVIALLVAAGGLLAIFSWRRRPEVIVSEGEEAQRSEFHDMLERDLTG
ncbi:MAG: cytochrome c-type biogenesis protein CcmH [Anaerolineaceae bacterium]|nr:cytochrome c-type biogenesis protein CcmH [Anaerolineae bacterium]MCB9461442.1 cytochrome c-type biogenesis protein CcmH [Anaerolineaceae bacterium]